MSKMVLTNKVDVRDSFKDKLYITESGSVYGVFLLNSHFCLATDFTFEGVLAKLDRLLGRYNTYTKLEKSLRECTYSTKVSEATFSMREKHLKATKNMYKSFVDEIVDKHEGVLVKERNKTPIKIKTKKPKKKIVKRV